MDMRLDIDPMGAGSRLVECPNTVEEIALATRIAVRRDPTGEFDYLGYLGLK